MNEAEFVSLCKANSYYCSQKQQTEATKKPSRHPLSPTTPTYVHLLVQSGPHSAAIQISINPFSLEKYPKQIFFSSKYRYTLCCSKAPPDVAVAVREKVQQVSDAQYQPCRWDFSHDECVTFDGFCDSTKISKATCWKEARSRLCDYLKSPEIIPKDPLSDKPNTDNSQPLFSANDCRDEAFVNGAATKIRRGLENLTKTSPALPQLSLNDKRSWREKARYYEDYFWDRGNTIGVVLQETRWTNNLLSSCFRLICSDSETRSSDEDSPISEKDDRTDPRTRKTWLTAVEIINSLVNGLLEPWGWKAYLIYSALASTGFYFSACSRLSWDRRQDVVTNLVEEFCSTAPSITQPSNLWDPALLLSCALEMDYDAVCTKLKLGAAITMRIDAEKASWRMQISMAGSIKREYKLITETIETNEEVVLSCPSCSASNENNVHDSTTSLKPDIKTKEVLGTIVSRQLPDGGRGNEEPRNLPSPLPVDNPRPLKKRKTNDETDPDTQTRGHGTLGIREMQTDVLTVPTVPGINPNHTIDTISPFDLDLNVVSTSAEHGNPSSLGRTLREHSDLGMNSDRQRVILTQEQDLWNTNANFDMDISLTVGGPSEHNRDQGRSFSFGPNSTPNSSNSSGIFTQEQDLGEIFAQEQDLWPSVPDTNSETQGGIFSREEDLWPSVPEKNSETQEQEAQGIFSQEEDLQVFGSTLNLLGEHGVFNFDMRASSS